MKIRMTLTALITGFLLCCSCNQNEPEVSALPDLNENDGTGQKVEILYIEQVSLRVVTETDKVIYITRVRDNRYNQPVKGSPAKDSRPDLRTAIFCNMLRRSGSKSRYCSNRLMDNSC